MRVGMIGLGRMGRGYVPSSYQGPGHKSGVTETTIDRVKNNMRRVTSVDVPPLLNLLFMQ